MKDLIQQRVDQYEATSTEAEESALKEVTQEVLLYALSKAGFFSKATFVGGTALRIIHGLERFSEDLDFSLITPDSSFLLDSYVQSAVGLMEGYGFAIESTTPESSGEVERRFIRDSGLKRVLKLNYIKDLRKKIRIKIEVDTSPPDGAESELEYHIFPQDFSLRVHSLGSLYAGKLHALLCRPFTKGRDWYDFGWYVRRGVAVNTRLLGNALYQYGPWEGTRVNVTAEWLIKRLEERIEELDWDDVRRDIAPLLSAEQRETLKLWSAPLFLKKARLVKAANVP